MTIDYETFIEQVRDANPIEDVVQSAEFGGVQLERGAHLLTATHHDSLKVSIDYQNYHWYSKEGNEKFWKGDVYAWVQMQCNCDFMEALRKLAFRAHLDMPRLDDETRIKISAVRLAEDAYSIAAKILAEWLWKDEAALAYARGRGWTDETIREANLGFTGRGAYQEYEQMKTALATAIDLHSPAAVAILGLRGGVKSWGDARGIDVSKWIEKDRIPSLLGWVNIFGLIYPFVERGRTVTFTRRHLKLDENGVMVGSDDPKSYNLPKELVGARRMYRNRVWSKHTERGIFVEGAACAVTFLQWELQRRALLKKYRDEKKDPPAWLDTMPEMSATAINGKEWHGFADLISQETKGETAHDSSFIGLDNDKAGKNSIRGERGNEFEIVEKVGALTRLLEFPEKDANDWLKWMVKSEVSIEDQLELVNQQLGNAKPLAIHAARWMGQQRNEDQLKKASERVARILNSLNGADVQFYMKDLLSALYPLVGDDGERVYKTKRDIDQWLGKVKKEEKAGGKKEDNVEYSFGGRKGKWLLEYCYNPDTQKAHWAYRDPDGNVDEKDEVMIDGIIQRPNSPIGNKMVTGGAALFPSGLARKKDGSIDRKSTKELVTKMSSEFRMDYLFADHKWSMLSAYWVMGGWLYDNFHELVYLRMVGDAGAGKSALLNLLLWTSYRAIKMSGADSESTFFRITDEYRGSMFFEEADLPEGSGPENPIIKYINLGAFDGNCIYRMEEFYKPDGTKGWRATPYYTFCPKAFAMRGDFMDTAVASRSITIKLTAAETSAMKENNISWRMTDEMKRRLLHIRNLCLTWRLYEYSFEERELGWDLVDVEIPMRFNQVTIPLKSLAKNIDGTKDEEFLNQMETLLREHYQDLIGDASISWQARTAEAMWKIYTYSDLQERMDIKNDGSIFIRVGDVTSIVNNIADEMNAEGSDLRVQKVEYETIKGADGEEKQVERKRHKKDLEKGAQSIGQILRKDFQLEFPPRNGKGYRVKWDDAKMMAIGKKYGCLPAEDMIEKARQALAGRRGGMPEKKKLEQVQMTVLGNPMYKNEDGEWITEAEWLENEVEKHD
jgi:hypothetical protein